MPLPKLGNDDLLVWRFGVAADEPDVVDMPGAGIEPPTVWVDAIATVATDLRVLRYGRVVDPDRLVWELAVTGQDTVMIGWGTTAHVGGFRVSEGMQVDTSFAAAAAWVADIAQTAATPAGRWEPPDTQSRCATRGHRCTPHNQVGVGRSRSRST
ncbi:hypothetical protein [Nocardia sp. NPDC058497]|uniref:hypothetical protein n=1 Tax=Nocardia sp. NPDC058497 TaxID=3346529 RepID=UPI003668B9C9